MCEEKTFEVTVAHSRGTWLCSYFDAVKSVCDCFEEDGLRFSGGFSVCVVDEQVEFKLFFISERSVLEQLQSGGVGFSCWGKGFVLIKKSYGCS